MVQGRMKWTSRKQRFGLVAPDNGDRETFVRFSPAIASSYISDGQGGLVVKNAIATAEPTHQVTSHVEVRTRYQQGQWASGYEIAQVVPLGYRVRRSGTPDTLPEVFVPADVRNASDLLTSAPEMTAPTESVR
jgi:cold shock CspA family protein